MDAVPALSYYKFLLPGETSQNPSVKIKFLIVSELSSGRKQIKDLKKPRTLKSRAIILKPM